jgi:hypothetical protein
MLDHFLFRHIFTVNAIRQVHKSKVPACSAIAYRPCAVALAVAEFLSLLRSVPAWSKHPWRRLQPLYSRSIRASVSTSYPTIKTG